ncbi:hypothetical protein SRABI83_00804 [Arthrobacter sp. Bi83]|jgi:hypothetical protein|nr:hypothetical protein SRABI83_00804 [Arthrobacter sp. Bi83]
MTARSVSVVTGVIRCTMLFGKGTFSATQALSSASLSFAKAVNIFRATSPTPKWTIPAVSPERS